MKTRDFNIPFLKSENEEADWWASVAGRRLVKQESAQADGKGKATKDSPVVERLKAPAIKHWRGCCC